MPAASSISSAAPLSLGSALSMRANQQHNSGAPSRSYAKPVALASFGRSVSPTSRSLQLRATSSAAPSRGRRNRYVAVCSAPRGPDRRDDDMDFVAPPVLSGPKWYQRLPRLRLYALKDVNIAVLLGIAALVVVLYQQTAPTLEISSGVYTAPDGSHRMQLLDQYGREFMRDSEGNFYQILDIAENEYGITGSVLAADDGTLYTVGDTGVNLVPITNEDGEVIMVNNLNSEIR